MTIVLVCGGRDFGDYQLLARVLDQLHAESRFTKLIHGAAFGADRMAGHWAALRGIPVEAYPADWYAHGKSAGPIRNAMMLRLGKPDLVIAMPGGAGTADMVRKAIAAGTHVIIVKEEVKA